MIYEPVQLSVVLMPTPGKCIGVRAHTKATVLGALILADI